MVEYLMFSVEIQLINNKKYLNNYFLPIFTDAASNIGTDYLIIFLCTE